MCNSSMLTKVYHLQLTTAGHLSVIVLHANVMNIHHMSIKGKDAPAIFYWPLQAVELDISADRPAAHPKHVPKLLHMAAKIPHSMH